MKQSASASEPSDRDLDLQELEDLLRIALQIGDMVAAERVSGEIDQFPAPPPVPTLSAALYYVELGLKVFPLSPGCKVPYGGTRGCTDASNNPHLIRQWWDRWPQSNVAIATGHLVDVVDIDGLTGQGSRAVNWAKFETLKVLGTVSTPRPAGMHLYVPARAGMGNRAKIFPGVDYRGLGGFVVAPPSVLDARPGQTTGGYRWLHALDLDDL